jgi:hypothetical protein
VPSRTTPTNSANKSHRAIAWSKDDPPSPQIDREKAADPEPVRAIALELPGLLRGGERHVVNRQPLVIVGRLRADPDVLGKSIRHPVCGTGPGIYTHLRRIKEKTGCTRMAELIRKLNDCKCRCGSD